MMLGDTATNAIKTADQINIYLLIEIMIMLLSGIMGGIANYYLSRTENHHNNGILGYCFLGIVASFIVPLFLNMISSNLLETIETKQNNLLIFAGFCLVAAVFSRRFLDNIYNKLIQQVGKIQEDVNKIEEAASEIESSEIEMEETGKEANSLTSSDYKILSALIESPILFRSESGIVASTSIPQAEVIRRLKFLEGEGIILMRQGKDGRPRWSITPKGRYLVNNPVETEQK